MKFREKEIAEVNFSSGLEAQLKKEFDTITKLVSVICEAPVVFISLISNENFYVKSYHGVNISSIPFNASVYKLVIAKPQEIYQIKNVKEDIHFQDQSLFNENPGLVSYRGCSMITEDGSPLGVISVIDERHKELKTHQKEALLMLATQATMLMTTTKQLQHAQKDIQEKTETIENIVECTNSGTWHYDLETEDLVFNEEWAKLLGYTLSELAPINFDTWKSLVHPQDFEQANDDLESFSLGDSQTYDIEFRMLHKNGNWKWIRSKGKVIEFSKEGTPLKLFGTHTDIDENKKNEIELLKEKERFEYAAKATSDILWDWDLINDTIYYSDNYLKYFGYELSTTIASEYSKVWERHVHPDDVELVINLVIKALESDDETWEHEYRLKKKDNTYAHLIDKAYIVRDEKGLPLRAVGSWQDITLRNESELQLKVFESIINKTKDLIIITKAKPIHAPLGPEIIYVNEAVIERTGYTKEELIGKTPRIFQGPNTDTAILKDISNKLKNWEIVDVDIINYSKSKREYWVNLSIVPVAGEDGEFKYFISIQKDITDRKHYERSLTELNEELQKNATALEISNAELEQFAYVTSHDLQEPLRMVTSFLTQLEKKYGDVLDEKGKTYIHFAVDGAKRMRQLILDLLEYSRVGKTEEPLENVDLNAVMTDVIELSSRLITEKKASIIVDKLPMVKSYYTPLRQVFFNLVNNALKYSSKELTPKIRISAKQTQHSFKITVEDNGIGIKKEYLEKIFVIFQRLHTKDEYTGTGIGLAITKKLIEQLGGKIGVESIEGKGSKFSVEILKK